MAYPPGASKLMNLQPGLDQWSSSSFMIIDRDPLQDSTIQEFDTFDLHFSLEYSIPEVLDQAPCVHLKSMTLVHFRTSTFGSINFPCLIPPRMLPLGVHDLSMCVLPQIDDYESLWLFKLREFKTLHLHFLLECFHPKSMICRCVSLTNQRM